MPGDHINERSCAIRDVVACDLPLTWRVDGDDGPLR